MTGDAANGSLPTTVLTGFLGSGKTTLLRRALASPALADTAVIVNEIGEIAIDHHLVDYVEGAVLELPGGCLCCAVREDLARTLRDLFDRRDAGDIRPFRRIVIETTGLADPAPILFTLGADIALDGRLHLGRVVTVIDAVTGAETLARFAEAARQAAVADALVISKTDLAAPSPSLEAALALLNPEAERLTATDIADPGAALFQNPSPAPRERVAVEFPWAQPRPGEGARNVMVAGPLTPTLSPGVGEGVASGAAPHAQHSHGIDTFAVILTGGISRLDFARALGGLANDRGTDLLRVKGIVEFSDRPGRPAVVQGAQHAIFPPEWLDDWPADGAGVDRRSRLVFIVHKIARDEILARFAFAAPTLLGARASRPHDHHEPA
ncbi:MAG TPA: GTP-binding protein [Stellaceae bacterium]|nr:GTP-binding protein [Stellaceae bacterium]